MYILQSNTTVTETLDNIILLLQKRSTFLYTIAVLTLKNEPNNKDMPDS